jgi:hypothetical protein
MIIRDGTHGFGSQSGIEVGLGFCLMLSPIISIFTSPNFVHFIFFPQVGTDSNHAGRKILW